MLTRMFLVAAQQTTRKKTQTPSVHQQGRYGGITQITNASPVSLRVGGGLLSSRRRRRFVRMLLPFATHDK